MKKNLLFYWLLIAPVSLLFAQPAEFAFTPNNISCTVLASVEINGIPASTNNWIAAYDEDGNCAGALQLFDYGDQVFCNLQVYRDDFTTPGIDEGINEGETFTFKLWVAATGEILDHPTNVPPVTGFNASLGSCVIPSYSFTDQAILNFSSTEIICTQTINLNTGWNLISLDVSPADKTIQSVFGSLQPNNVKLVAGYENSIKVYDPNQPIFLNTLSEVVDGFGYWAKVQNADVLIVEGTCIADDFRISLNTGWNLIAYLSDTPQYPYDYFADLIADGTLEYVTGFDIRLTIFSPNIAGGCGLLGCTQMENGFGYWVKVN